MTAAPPKAPACTHAARAVCWLCSDQVSWWKTARIKAGYGETPPNYVATVVVPPRYFACPDCGQACRGHRCRACAKLRGQATRERLRIRLTPLKDRYK